MTRSASTGRCRPARAHPALGTIDWQFLFSPSSDFVMATRAVVVRPGATNRELPAGATQYLTVKQTAGWTDRPPKHRLPGARR